MKYEELEKRVESFLVEMKEISELMISLDAELENDTVEFKQVEEVDNIIKKLNKLNMPVPEELANLKLSLLGRKGDLKAITRIKGKFRQAIKFFVEMNSQYSAPDYVGKTPTSVVIFGVAHRVQKWKSIPILVCEMMYDLHTSEFHGVLDIKGNGVKYFSKEKKMLRNPFLIRNSNIYCETHFSARDCVRIARRVLKKFDYDHDDLYVRFKDRVIHYPPKG